MRISVVFPEPLGPIKPNVSPALIVILSLFTAYNLPNCLTRFLATTMGSPFAIPVVGPGILCLLLNTAQRLRHFANFFIVDKAAGSRLVDNKRYVSHRM